jgi:hypothetical protein
MKTLLALLFFLPLGLQAQSGTVNVSEFGAFGNDGSDEGQQLNKAFSNTNYDRVELEPGRVYYSSVPLKIASGKTIVFNGATIAPYASLPYNGGYFISTATATTHKATDVSIEVTEGAKTFTYAGAANLTPGEIVTLQNTITPYWSVNESEHYYYGWYSVVEAVNGMEVTLAHPAPVSFTANTILEYKTGKNIHILGPGTIDMTGRTGDFGLGLINTIESTIEYLTVKGTTPAQADGIKSGIVVVGVGNTVSHCISFGTSSATPGYSFSSAGNNNTFAYCTAWANRHGFTSAGRAYISTQINFLYDTAYYTGNTASAAGFDWHANAWHSRMQGCFATVGGTTKAGVQVRGRYDTAQYNHLDFFNTGTYLYGFLFFENPWYSIAQYNTITVTGGGNNRLVGSSNKLNGTPEGVRFLNNAISTASAYMPKWVEVSGNATERKIVAPRDPIDIPKKGRSHAKH